MKQYLLIFFIAIASVSCKSNVKSETASRVMASMSLGSSVQEGEDMQAYETISFGDGNTATRSTTQKQKKISKSAYYKFKENNLKLAKSNVDELIKKYKAEIINEEFDNTYYGTYSFQINIPAQNFDTFLNTLETKYGNPTSKNIKLTDETDRYYDIAMRLNSKKQYRDKCLELLKKASKISDIMEIEEKISSVQEDIESMEKGIAGIDYKVQNYYISLQFITDEYNKETYQEPTFAEKVWQSVKDGFRSITDFLLTLISYWAYIILAIIIYPFYRKYRRKVKSEGGFFKRFRRTKEQ